VKSKGVKKISYLIVPAEVNGTKVKGADHYFAAGGTIDDLKAAATTRQPNPHVTGDAFTDARLAETIADDNLQDHFIWCPGLAGDGGTVAGGRVPPTWKLPRP
jgi:hypothetical protein